MQLHNQSSSVGGQKNLRGKIRKQNCIICANKNNETNAPNKIAAQQQKQTK